MRKRVQKGWILGWAKNFPNIQHFFSERFNEKISHFAYISKNPHARILAKPKTPT
ncbi:MAG: hypothetical protein IJD43_07435 [Thermoguttaceae bacterium]|nr:hypothetical protein [Thermoguttaceae bacterium]